eukprot:783536_1
MDGWMPFLVWNHLNLQLGHMIEWKLMNQIKLYYETFQSNYNTKREIEYSGVTIDWHCGPHPNRNKNISPLVIENAAFCGWDPDYVRRRGISNHYCLGHKNFNLSTKAKQNHCYNGTDPLYNKTDHPTVKGQDNVVPECGYVFCFSQTMDMFLSSLSKQFNIGLPSSESIKSELNGRRRVKSDILRSFLKHLNRCQSTSKQTCGVMKCKHCGVFGKAFKCARCRNIWYCSVNCESQHQSTHSKWCNPGRKLHVVYKNNAKQRNMRVSARVHVPCATATEKSTTNVGVSIPTTQTETHESMNIEIKENNDDDEETTTRRKQSNGTNKLPRIRTHSLCLLAFRRDLKDISHLDFRRKRFATILEDICLKHGQTKAHAQKQLQVLKSKKRHIALDNVSINTNVDFNICIYSEDETEEDELNALLLNDIEFAKQHVQENEHDIYDKPYNALDLFNNTRGIL